MQSSASPSPWIALSERARPSRRPRCSLTRSPMSDPMLTASISKSSPFSLQCSVTPPESSVEDGFEEDVETIDEDIDKTPEDATDGEEDEVEGIDDDGATSPLSIANSLSNTRLRSSKSLPLEACTDTSCWRYRIYSTD